MGWTITDLDRNRTSLQYAKEDHVRESTRYGNTIKAELIAHEWRPSTWYAIIKLTYLDGHERKGQSETFLRTDMIEATPARFGYKDMTEQMGPNVDDKPSEQMKALIYKHIPTAKGYATAFRDRMGIKYNATAQAA